MSLNAIPGILGIGSKILLEKVGLFKGDEFNKKNINNKEDE